MTLIYRCVRLIFAAVLLAIGNTAAAQLPGNVAVAGAQQGMNC